MHKHYAVAVGVDLELSHTLFAGIHLVLRLISRILDEPVQNVDARVKENYSLENDHLAFLKHHVYHRSIIAVNVDLLLMVFAVENQAWRCDGFGQRINALSQIDCGVGFCNI